MKFYLIKNQRVLSASGHEEEKKTENWTAKLKYCTQLVIGDVIPVNRKSLDDQEKCEKIKKLLIQHCHAAASQVIKSNDELTMWQLNLLVGVSEKRNEANTHFKGYLQLDGIFVGNCLQGIRDLSDNDATILIKYVVLDGPPAMPVFQVCKVTSKELNVTKGKKASCMDYDIEFPIQIFRNWKQEYLRGIFTITVDFPDEALNGNYKSMKSQATAVTIPLNQRILHDEILPDVTLVTDAGSEFKAHKVFLAAQSSVFLTMFQTDMTEARDNKVEVPEMSDESVKALLRYVYYKDKKVLDENSVTVFELFCAAHKYHMESLEKLMRETMLGKSPEWFDLDVAVRLFVFARNLVPADEEIKKKTVEILKTHAKILESSYTYQELFKKNPTAAMELCMLALLNSR